MNLGKSIKVALAIREKRQQDLADHMGKSRQQISKWISTGSIGSNNVELVCKYFDMPVSEFVALGE